MEKIPEKHDDFEPEEDTVNPWDTGELWDENEELSIKQNSAPTEDFKSIDTQQKEVQLKLENMKQDLINQLSEEGVLAERKRWESVLKIFHHESERLTGEEREKIQYILNEGARNVLETKTKREDVERAVNEKTRNIRKKKAA